jgi:hypothetical protein
MKIFLFLVLSVGLLLAIGCGGPVTEAEARQTAQDRFAKVCTNFHYVPASFTGPTKTDVGGAAFAYEWKDKTPGRNFGVLITVDDGGVTNVSFLGTIP